MRKNHRASFCIAMLASAFYAAFPLHARADDTADTALLTAGPWKVSTKGVSDAWTFAKDGTFTTASK